MAPPSHGKGHGPAKRASAGHERYPTTDHGGGSGVTGPGPCIGETTEEAASWAMRLQGWASARWPSTPRGYSGRSAPIPRTPACASRCATSSRCAAVAARRGPAQGSRQVRSLFHARERHLLDGAGRRTPAQRLLGRRCRARARRARRRRGLGRCPARGRRAAGRPGRRGGPAARIGARCHARAARPAAGRGPLGRRDGRAGRRRDDRAHRHRLALRRRRAPRCRARSHHARGLWLAAAALGAPPDVPAAAAPGRPAVVAGAGRAGRWPRAGRAGAGALCGRSGHARGRPRACAPYRLAAAGRRGRVRGRGPAHLDQRRGRPCAARAARHRVHRGEAA